MQKTTNKQDKKTLINKLKNEKQKEVNDEKIIIK